MLDSRGDSYGRLLVLSLQAMVLEAAQPVATLVCVALLGRHPLRSASPHDPTPRHRHPADDAVPRHMDAGGAAPTHGTNTLAAFAQTESTVAFASNVFGFLVVVTLTQVARARVARDKGTLVRRILLALGAAVGIGVVLAAVLFAAHPEVFALFRLDPEVRRLAWPYYRWRLLCVPLMLIQKACAGILAGFKRINLLTALKVAGAAQYLAAVLVVLYVLHRNLATVGLAILAAMLLSTLCYVASVLVATLRFPAGPAATDTADPDTAKSGDGGGVRGGTEPGQIQRPPAPSEPDPGRRREPGFGGGTVTAGASCFGPVAEYLAKSGNMLVRSLLLQASVFALSIAASRLGTNTLAANQVIYQVWIVASYLADGFADVATILGCDYVAEGAMAKFRRLTLRLCVLTAVSGAAATALLGACAPALQRLFTDDPQTVAALHRGWPVLVGMQLPNAFCFLFDGLLYAFEAYAFTRSVMLVGFFLLFLPTIAAALLHFHSFLTVWLAKAALNSWRCASAIAFVWRRARSTSAAGRPVGDGARRAGETQPLLPAPEATTA